MTSIFHFFNLVTNKTEIYISNCVIYIMLDYTVKYSTYIYAWFES